MKLFATIKSLPRRLHMRFKKLLIKLGVKGRRGKMAEKKLMDYCHDQGIGV